MSSPLPRDTQQNVMQLFVPTNRGVSKGTSVTINGTDVLLTKFVAFRPMVAIESTMDGQTQSYDPFVSTGIPRGDVLSLAVGTIIEVM
jgi:hypothetical protein